MVELAGGIEPDLVLAVLLLDFEASEEDVGPVGTVDIDVHVLRVERAFSAAGGAVVQPVNAPRHLWRSRWSTATVQRLYGTPCAQSLPL